MPLTTSYSSYKGEELLQTFDFSMTKKHDDYIADSSVKPSDNSKSTLSLHIAAYENSVEEADCETLIIPPIKSFNPINQLQLGFHQNLFEFPRQQKDQKTKPEVIKFKSSKKLLNPNIEARDQQNAVPKSTALQTTATSDAVLSSAEPGASSKNHASTKSGAVKKPLTTTLASSAAKPMPSSTAPSKGGSSSAHDKGQFFSLSS
uniref:Uncharacterized protein n=1 Tax=Panagrolaimus sp. ES5 TaxID=591445 RepID=A0AC34FYE8_9BILA